MKVNRIGGRLFGDMGEDARRTWGKCKNVHQRTCDHIRKHKVGYQIGGICLLGMSIGGLYAWLTSETYERMVERRRYEKMLAKIQEQRRLNMLG